MRPNRREFLMAAGAGMLVMSLPGCATLNGERSMYGLIGKMKAKPGQRDALIAILLDGFNAMPGCLSYIVASDPADADAIWSIEV